jgi:hypothetical protein
MGFYNEKPLIIKFLSFVFLEVLLLVNECFNLHLYGDVGVQPLSLVSSSNISIPARYLFSGTK